MQMPNVVLVRGMVGFVGQGGKRFEGIGEAWIPLVDGEGFVEVRCLVVAVEVGEDVEVEAVAVSAAKEGEGKGSGSPTESQPEGEGSAHVSSV